MRVLPEPPVHPGFLVRRTLEARRRYEPGPCNKGAMVERRGAIVPHVCDRQLVYGTSRTMFEELRFDENMVTSID
jgi:hypothetical protein